jgi:xanthine dehydrogenase YagS FAD-binding subunit
MRPFEYASPQTETEALELLNETGADTAVLAGGTDLLNLLKRDLLQPTRVVDIKQVESLRGLRVVDGSVEIGVLTTLEELSEDPLAADYRCLRDVVDATHSIQVQSMGTVGGDLCHLPNCWYFRNGDGLLAMHDGRSLVERGDNRYHAILGNAGPAKFVSASRLAPPLSVAGAEVRIVGPDPAEETFLPLEHFYRTPKTPSQGPTVLRPGQLVTHLRVPFAADTRNATYEVLEIDGLDWPLAAASAMLRLHGSLVTEAAICLGHVAPVPWMAHSAAQSLVGGPINDETAAMAGDIALADATPLSENDYKVQIARTAVKRALLRAVDLLEGGL